MSSINFKEMPPKLSKSKPQVISSTPTTPGVVTNARQVGFASINLSVLLPQLTTRRLPTYNAPWFTLRACPSSLLPTSPPPPFPPHMIKVRPESKIIKFGIVTSRAKLSKLAVERNMARRRIKSALDVVVNRGIGLGGGEDEGVEYVLDGESFHGGLIGIAYIWLCASDHTYFATLKGDILNAKYEEVVAHVAMALVKIRKSHTNGFEHAGKKFSR
jgi:hypothetical protein